jgi:hypothetical protein
MSGSNHILPPYLHGVGRDTTKKRGNETLLVIIIVMLAVTTRALHFEDFYYR